MTEQGSLRLRHVGKQYQVKGRIFDVLHDVTLDAEPGSFISLVGSSGCGKSTLLRLIVGLDPTYDGRILLDGEPIRGFVWGDADLFAHEFVLLSHSARAITQESLLAQGTPRSRRCQIRDPRRSV